MIFIGKISKGCNSVKNEEGVTVLFLYTSPDRVLYVNTKFHEKYSRRYLTHRADTIFIGKFKGALLRKNVDAVMVLFLCTSSGDGLYLYKVS